MAAYAYPLLIKHLLVTPIAQASPNEIVYRDRVIRERVVERLRALAGPGRRHQHEALRGLERTDHGARLGGEQRPLVGRLEAERPLAAPAEVAPARAAVVVLLIKASWKAYPPVICHCSVM